MIEIVSATRLSESDFWNKAALGISLRRLGNDARLKARISFNNRLGLSDVYNARIADAESAPLLVFVHDDVWIDDYFIVERVVAGLEAFDLIGVAGNRRRVPNQPSWAFINDTFTWDESEHLSGVVAHGQHPFGKIARFGPVPAACELLDGVFLAVRKDKLGEVRFDPQFDFHFYDLDFCRSARAAGLRVGTWPICLTHQSGGAFGRPPWREKLALYRQKWGA